MGRGYDPEVDLRVPADRVENAGHSDPAMPRFEDLGLHHDSSENCDICGNGQVGQFKE